MMMEFPFDEALIEATLGWCRLRVTPDAAEELAQRVESELALGYTVRFCSDLDALPDPQFVTAKPTRAEKAAAEEVVSIDKPKGFLGKLKQRFMSYVA